MKKFRNLTLLTLIAALLLTPPLKTVVKADSITTSSAGHTFTSDWEEQYSVQGDKVFKYGYNTFLINEDYAHCNVKYSRTELTNARGTFYANAALFTTWSKIEVTHSGTYVTYRVTGV